MPGKTPFGSMFQWVLSIYLSIYKAQPELTVVVKHLCLVEYQDNVGIFEILHCDVFVPVHMHFFNEKFTRVVLFFRPRFDNGNRNPLALIVFRNENRLSRSGCPYDLDNVIEIDPASQLFDCLFSWRLKQIFCSSQSAVSRREEMRRKSSNTHP